MPAYRVIRGPELSADGRTLAVRVSIWHSAAERDGGEPAFITDWFLFSRGSATGQVIDTDPLDGWPLLSDGSRAPAHTGSSIRDLVIAKDRSLPTTDALVSFSAAVAAAVPGNQAVQDANTAVQIRWSALRQWVIDRWLGKPYLPDGAQWKYITRPMLRPADVRIVLRQRYEREVAFKAAAEGLAADPDLTALAGTEGDL